MVALIAFSITFKDTEQCTTKILDETWLDFCGRPQKSRHRKFELFKIWRRRPELSAALCQISNKGGCVKGCMLNTVVGHSASASYLLLIKEFALNMEEAIHPDMAPGDAGTYIIREGGGGGRCGLDQREQKH